MIYLDADFSHAVQAAQGAGKGFVDFKKNPFEKRLGLARAFVYEFENNTPLLRETLAQELGYPEDEVRQELAASAQEGHRLLQNASPQQPVGPVLIYGSWSSPCLRMTGPVLTALLNGNTVLLYCTPSAAKIYSQMEEILLKAGFPKDSLALVCTQDAEAVDTLLDHPALRAVHFSGHFYEGDFLRAKKQDARKLYKASFGGRNPVIFLHDASIENLRDLMLRSLRFHMLGEKRFNRWFVQEKNYTDFCARLRAVFESLVPEDTGRFPNAVYAEQFQRQASDGLAGEKNWLAAPGRAENSSPLPALSLDFNNCSPWQQSEVLGPVLTVTRFKNSAEAVKFCNTTFFADSACVFSSSEEKSREVALQLNMPKVYVNKFFTPHRATADHAVYESGFGNDQTDFDFFRQKKILL